jgi:hypothetical protein
MMTIDQQYGALLVLDYLSDLFTMANRQEFTRESILVVLNNVKNDSDIFDADVVTAHAIATADLDS